MRSHVYFLIVAIVAMSACSDSKNQATDSKQTKQTELPKIKGNRLLTLEIEGMTCVMGCGGTIRKELVATNAIESCEFEFEEDRALNTAKITFDKNKITVDKIISIVSSLNKGQFKVGDSSSEDVSVNIKTKVEEVSVSEEDEAQLNVSSSTEVELPNFVEILAIFFHN